MSNWLTKLLFGKSIEKEAEQTDSKKEFQRKIENSTWIDDVMKLNEAEIQTEAEKADEEEADVRLGVEKTAGVYHVGETEEEEIHNDYKLKISGLSDRNLAEMCAEFYLKDANAGDEAKLAEIQSCLKFIKNNREEAEKRLFNHIKNHTMLDWKEAFKTFEEWKLKEPKKEDIYGEEFKTEKQSWEKKDHDFTPPTDKEKAKEFEGGKEEEKGQIGKEAQIDSKELQKAVDFFSNQIDQTLFYDGKKGLYVLYTEDGRDAVIYTPEELIDEYNTIQEMKEASQKSKVEKEGSAVTDKIRKKVEKKMNDVVDELLDEKEVMGPGGHIPDMTGPHGLGEGPGEGKGDGSGMKEVEEVDVESAKGIPPFIYQDLEKAIANGLSFEDAKTYISKNHPDFELRKEDFDEAMKKKEASQEIEAKVRSVPEINKEIQEIFKKDEMFWESVDEVYKKSTKDGKRLEQLSAEWEKAVAREKQAFKNVEIEAKVAKKETIEKIASITKKADIESPWIVAKNENGEDVIARRTPPSIIRAQEKKKKEVCSKDLQ